MVTGNTHTYADRNGMDDKKSLTAVGIISALQQVSGDKLPEHLMKYNRHATESSEMKVDLEFVDTDN